MPVGLTKNARIKAAAINKEPQIVLEIEGVDTIYGANIIKKFIRIGDPNLYIGNDWVIGGLNAIEDQSDLISFTEGASTNITQNIDLDKARGSTITSMQVALLDKRREITRLISPGVVVDDILGRRCKVWLGFEGTAFKEDFIIIFRGIIDEVNSKQGTVVFNIAHPTQKQRQDIFIKFQAKLSGAHNNSTTSIVVDDVTGFLQPVLGPDGLNDTSLKFYVRIDDEIIRYTSIVGSTLTGCTRGALNTTAASHDADVGVDSFYRLEGNAIDLALKLMLSGWNDYYSTGNVIKNFNYITPSETVDNVIFFSSTDPNRDYGITVGDYITTAGSAFGANNVTLKTISDIVITDNGSYIVVNGVTFVSELDTTGTISFRSKYDTLGEGLMMNADEVDVEQHEFLRNLFLSNFDMDIYLKDTINGKEFIEQELYLPAAAYSLPRKSRASLGYHIGPLPGSDMPRLDEDNIIKASALSIKRSTNKNFTNTIIYKFDEDSIDDRFLQGKVTVSGSSLTQIPVGVKTFVVASKGMRTSLAAETLATSAANRRLNRYKLGAEYIENMQVKYGTGFRIDIGDIIILDNENLNLSDTTTGKRGGPAKMYEVVNKSLNFKTGDVSLSLVNTSFSGQNRYGLISPASKIKAGISTTEFIIEPSGFYSIFGSDEFLKWQRFKHATVRIRSLHFGTVGSSTILRANSNHIYLDTPLAFTPSSGMIMEVDTYNSCTEELKLRYGFMRDSTFDDGKSQYLML